MKQNVLSAVLMALVVVLAAVAVRQHSQINELKRAAFARNTVVETVHEDPVRPIEAPAPVVTKEEPALPSASASAHASAAGETNNPGKNYMASLAGMMKNPQMKEMVRSQQKAMLDRQYSSLFKYLSTRPSNEIDALNQLLEDRQMALVDAGIAMMSGSADDKQKAIEETKTIKADYDKKIEDLLGAQDYDIFKQYEATMGERMQVQMFKDALPTAAALSDQQENELILAMADERKAMPALAALNNQNSDPSQLTEDRIAEIQKQLDQVQLRYADRAAAILSPAQLEQFKKFQEQWSTMQMAGLKMAATMFGNKDVTPAAP